jgi:hypothetical protein
MTPNDLKETPVMLKHPEYGPLHPLNADDSDDASTGPLREAGLDLPSMQPLGEDDGHGENIEPGGPSPAEEWRQMAADGDIRGLMAVVGMAKWNGIDLRDGLALLRQAVAASVRKDPTAFAKLVSTEMLGAIGGMVLRSNFYLQQLLVDQDDALNHRRTWSTSRDLEEFLPGLMSLQLHFAELVKLNASAERLTELARQHKVANAEATPRRRPSRPRKPGTPSRIKKQRRKPRGS